MLTRDRRLPEDWRLSDVRLLEAEEVGAQLIEFVENLQVGGLGAMGLAVLLITIVSLVHKIEMAFNYAWRVTRPRGMLERFSRYLTVVMVGPVLVFTALTIIGSITGEAVYQEVVAMPLVATAVDLGGKLVLPLEYLERCRYADDALVLFTDHDVVFQGGYASLRAAYARAVRAAARRDGGTDTTHTHARRNCKAATERFSL